MTEQDKIAHLLKKRQRIVEKYFLDYEYKKRNFIVKNDISKYENVMCALNRHFVDRPDGEIYSLPIEYKMLAKKHDLDIIPLPYVSREMSDAIIAAEIESRQKYEIAFYALMTPTNIEDYVRHVVLMRPFIEPTLPFSFNDEKSLDYMLEQAILAFNHYTRRSEFYLKNEKDQALMSMKKSLNGGEDIKNIASYLVYCKCTNGHELTPFELNLLFNNAKSIKLKDMRVSSFESRLLGLFIFDFMLVLASMGKERDINAFLKVFHEIFKLPATRHTYPDSVQKPYRDALRTAIRCVDAGKILPIMRSGEMQELPKVTLPKHVVFYEKMKELYIEIIK